MFPCKDLTKILQNFESSVIFASWSTQSFKLGMSNDVWPAVKNWERLFLFQSIVDQLKKQKLIRSKDVRDLYLSQL